MLKLSIPPKLTLLTFAISLLSALPARALPPVPETNAPNPAPASALPSSGPLSGQPGGQSSNVAGFGPVDPTPPTGFTSEQIITKFAARETEFAKALSDYTFRQTVKIETVDQDTNKANGSYNQVTDISYDDASRRSEHVVFAPGGELKDVMLSQSDFDDIAHRLPFVLTTADLPQYDITYLGRQKVDDLETYVFQAGPHKLEKNKRYFQGKVWVDQKDLQIVLINGKSVPDDVRKGHEDLSPPTPPTTRRSTATTGSPPTPTPTASSTSPPRTAPSPWDVRIRYTVKYTDYKRFRAKSRIIYNGETLPPTDPNAPKSPAAPDPSVSDPKGASTDPTALPPTDPNAPNLKHPK